MPRYTVHIPPIPYPMDGYPSVYCPPDAVDFASLTWGRWGSGGEYAARHMFVDDWRIQHVWRKPGEGLAKAILAGTVTAPDFTIDDHYPLPLVQYQVWRSRIITAYWQAHDVVVVPVLQWGQPVTWDICASGIEKGSVVAVRGPQRGTDRAWLRGMFFMLDRIQPLQILHFGRRAEYPGNVLFFPLRSR